MDDMTAPPSLHLDMSSSLLPLDPFSPTTWASPSSFSDFPLPAAPPHRHKSTTTATSNAAGSMGAMREMIFRIAAMQPIHIDPEAIKAPRRRNVRISKDPQSVAARQRRERISQKIRILQRLVPGGTKMDTASMLDEAVHYLKFLKRQLSTLQQTAAAATTSFSSNNNNFMNNINCANNIGYSSALLRASQSHLQFPPSMAPNSSSLQMH